MLLRSTRANTRRSILRSGGLFQSPRASAFASSAGDSAPNSASSSPVADGNFSKSKRGAHRKLDEKEKDDDARIGGAFQQTATAGAKNATKRFPVKKMRNGVPSFTQQVSIKGLAANPSALEWDWRERVTRASDLKTVNDPHVHPSTRETLESVLTALLASHVGKLPAVSSGLVVLSCPYKGADLFVRSLLENQIASLSAPVYYVHILPEDLFPRLSGFDVVNFPPIVSPSEAAETAANVPATGSGAGRRKSPMPNMFGGPGGPPTIVLEMDSNGATQTTGKLPPGFKHVGGFAGGAGELESDTPLIPYPWFTPYTTSLTQAKEPKSLLIPRIQSEFPRSDFHDLIHKTFDQFFGSLCTHLNSIGNPPTVVYFEDLLDLITPDSSELDETEIVNSFANALAKARESTPLVVVTGNTASTLRRLVDPQKRVNPGSVNAIANIMKAIRGSGTEPGASDAGGSGGQKKPKPMKFHSKLDDYIGPVTVPVYPPIHLGPPAMLAFQARMKKDLRAQMVNVNRREMSVVLESYFGESGGDWKQWLEEISGGGAAKLLEERVLSPSEIEQVLLLATGNGVKRFRASRTEMPIQSAKTVADAPAISSKDFEEALKTFSGNIKTLGAISAGAEFAGVFANPADHLTLTKHESEILKTCLIKPTDLHASFQSIGGLEKTKKVIEELIQLPLMRPDLFSFGVLKQNTTGLLLFGPPGTGKTLLAKSIASSSGANFLNIQMSSIQSKWVGENEKNVKAIFSLARKLKPCVIFVDEIDALLKVRVRDQPHWVTNTINEWMLEWDGINSKGSDGLIVVGATNRPFDLDEAVLRRLPRRLFVNLPDEKERYSILDIILTEETVESPRSEVLDFVVAKTEGFSGSDLKNLCIAAALGSVRRLLAEEADSLPAKDEIKRVLRQIDFENALERGDVVPSLSEKAELMKELMKWDKMYGLKAGGGRRDLGGWGFDLQRR